MKNLIKTLIVLIAVIGNLNAQELKISSFKIFDNKIEVIALNNSGQIIVNKDIIGTVTSTGIVRNKNQKIIAQFLDNYSLSDASGKKLVQIKKNGEVDNGSVVNLNWSKKGTLLKGTEITGISISPVNEELFRVASTLIYLNYFFTIEEDGITKEYEAPKELIIPQKLTSDFIVKNSNETDKVKNMESLVTNCNTNNPKRCLSLYKVYNTDGFIWKLKSNNNSSGRIGVTYGQRLGLNTSYSTNTITIAPGQIKGLGYGRFGPGDTRHVWIISAWWE